MVILRNGQYEEQSKFRRFLDKLNKKVSPGYKTNAEVLNEQKTKKEDFTRERLKEINPKLLVALDIQEKPENFFLLGVMVMNIQIFMLQQIQDMKKISA